MDVPHYPIEPLGQHHDRAAFSCGNRQIDSFMHARIGQFQARRLAQPFVMVERPQDDQHPREERTVRIVGFYTLSALGLDYARMPHHLRRGLPSRLRVGMTIIGHLAVDSAYQGRGLGRLLLLDALHRTLHASLHVASRAVIVDAIDDAARIFYQRYGFIPFEEDKSRLYLPMETIAAM